MQMQVPVCCVVQIANSCFVEFAVVKIMCVCVFEYIYTIRLIQQYVAHSMKFFFSRITAKMMHFITNLLQHRTELVEITLILVTAIESN